MNDKKENIKNAENEDDFIWFALMAMYLSGFGKDERVDDLKIKVAKLEGKLDTLIELIK